MLDSKNMFYRELFYISLAIVIIWFAVSFGPIVAGNQISYPLIFFNLIMVALVVIISIFAKKVVAYFYEAKIEHKAWTIQRFGFGREQHFNKPVPAGIIIPVFLSIITLGYWIWMAVLEFDIYSTTARAAKRHGMHRFTEITEIHMGLIAAAGVVANLFAAVIGYIIGFPEFSRLSIYYACYSMIPLGNLDGAKIFFSSGDITHGISKPLGLPTLWAVLGIICLIFLFFSVAVV
jgi:hypothetical protein